MTGPVAQIALDGAAFAFDRLYSYIIPLSFRKKPMSVCGLQYHSERETLKSRV